MVFKYIYMSPIASHTGSASPGQLQLTCFVSVRDPRHCTHMRWLGSEGIPRSQKRKGVHSLFFSHYLCTLRDNSIRYTVPPLPFSPAIQPMASEHEAIHDADPLTATLSAIIDRYRQGVVERFAAQAEIFQCVGDCARSDAKFDKSATVAVYLEQIDEINEINASAENRRRYGVAATASRSVSATNTSKRKRREKQRGGSDPSESDPSSESSFEGKARSG